MPRVVDSDPLVERELQRVQELNLLEPGELLIEYEVTVIDGSVGSIVVTDRRVMFVSTTLFRKKTKLLSIPVHDVLEAGASAVWGWGMKDRGNVTLKTGTEGTVARTIVCRQIPGGVDRATEIVESILRERERYGQRASLTSEGS